MRVMTEPPPVVRRVLCAAVAVLGGTGLERFLGKNLMDVPKQPEAEKALWELVSEQCVLNPNHPRYFLHALAEMSQLNASATHATAFKVRAFAFASAASLVVSAFDVLLFQYAARG
jgi:hypothetical protein